MIKKNFLRMIRHHLKAKRGMRIKESNILVPP
jgi:hypothetical protein